MPIAAITIEDKVRIPAKAFDFQGFRRWVHSDGFPETGKISFIAGQIEVDMSPEELISHNLVKRDVSADLTVFVRKADVGELFVDGALLINEAANLSTEPDFMFCSWDSIQQGKVAFMPSAQTNVGASPFSDEVQPSPSPKKPLASPLVEVRGTPDLVGEIISRSSVGKDTVRLRKTYFAAGIPEYWLIDARSRNLSFQILVRGKPGYTAAKPDDDGFSRSRVLQRRFRLVRRKNRIGGACYRLLQR